MSRQPDPGPFTIELTEEEVLEELCWPHPPPGQWRVEEVGEPDTAHVDEPVEVS